MKLTFIALAAFASGPTHHYVSIKSKQLLKQSLKCNRHLNNCQQHNHAFLIIPFSSAFYLISLLLDLWSKHVQFHLPQQPEGSLLP